MTDFIKDSVSWNIQGNQRPRDYYNQTLNYLLTEEHLSKQARFLGWARNERGGNNIGIHKNDLEKWVELQNKMKEDKAQERARGKERGGPSKQPRSKRKIVESDDDGDGEEAEEAVDDAGELSPRATRAAKRARKP